MSQGKCDDIHPSADGGDRGMTTHRFVEMAFRVYDRRTSGRYCHHWSPGRNALAGGQLRPRKCAAKPCANNLRQIGQASLMYLEQFKKLPPARMQNSAKNAHVHGYFIHILPWLEERNVRDMYTVKRDVPWDSTTLQPNGFRNSDAIKIRIATFVCPSYGEHRDIPMSDYAVVLGPVPVYYRRITGVNPNPSGQPKKDITCVILDHEYRNIAKVRDGMAHTIMITECGGRPHEWRQWLAH